mgnify:CR=1 FL=1
MPHSLKAKIKGLRYKGIITDKECDRLCKALDNESVLEKIAEYLKDVWKNEMQVHIEPTDVDNERTTGADRQVPAMYKPEEQRQRQD